MWSHLIYGISKITWDGTKLKIKHGIPVRNVLFYLGCHREFLDCPVSLIGKCCEESMSTLAKLLVDCQLKLASGAI
jgi:hypothetical protein